ncbi:hypothetical protein [Nonomuraea roseola]|uniref:Uncharacterized protein n=1 Tax=Nonomuraea roseola TaxID=46179 RepID=A0ABV5Q3D4_9ACTN
MKRIVGAGVYLCGWSMGRGIVAMAARRLVLGSPVVDWTSPIALGAR